MVPTRNVKGLGLDLGLDKSVRAVGSELAAYWSSPPKIHRSF